METHEEAETVKVEKHSDIRIGSFSTKAEIQLWPTIGGI